MDRSSRWTDEDFLLMAEELEDMKRENRRLRLEKEISELQQQIDQTLGEIATSTPSSDMGYPQGVRQGSQEASSTPRTKESMKPRRLLPPTSTRNGEDKMIDDRYVTFRKKKDKPSAGTEGSDITLGDKQTVGSSKSTVVKPATYDGSSAWTDYKAHFDACAALNGWDETQKGLYLSVSLRGQAQGVFGNLSTKTTNYNELVRALEDRFSPKNQTELYRVQLRDRQQKATESMAELGQDIRRLTNLAYPSAPVDVRETLAKEQFIDALINSDMRLRIKQSRPTDLNDAVRHAVELESFYRAEKKQQGLLRSTASDVPSSEMDSLKKSLSNLQTTVNDMRRLILNMRTV